MQIKKLSKSVPTEIPNWFMKAEGNLNFDGFLAEVGIAQTESFSKQTKCDVIYQICLTSSFFATTFHLIRSNI